MIKLFFQRDLNLVHVIGGAAITHALYHSHYWAAVAILVVSVVVSVWGELRLEKRAA